MSFNNPDSEGKAEEMMMKESVTFTPSPSRFSEQPHPTLPLHSSPTSPPTTPKPDK